MENINKTRDMAKDLKALYEGWGYKRYSMSKFEEYDLYLENKNFLVSDSVITFTDFNGKLMALKPDVTLSIVKNYREEDGTQKLFYDENVYRAQRGTREVKENRQIGLECIGRIDMYSAAEVVSIAAKSLSLFGGKWIMDLSNMAFVSGILESAEIPQALKPDILKCIGEKNPHDIRRICAASGIPEALTERLAALAEMCEALPEGIKRLEGISINEETEKALAELKELSEILELLGCEDCIRLDFSVVNDMSYYDGIVFQGYIEGIPGTVLSGGSYNPLLKKLGKNAGAIGFAVYLGLVERYLAEKPEYDADVLLVYSEEDSAAEIAKAAADLRRKGFGVHVNSSIPENIRCKFVMKVSDASSSRM